MEYKISIVDKAQYIVEGESKEEAVRQAMCYFSERSNHYVESKKNASHDVERNYCRPYITVEEC